MKITVLTENNSRIDNYLLSEPGLSFFIEINDKKILFDTGYSDVFLTNAQKLNINLEEITDVVISHGHNDHTGGLRHWNISKKGIKLTAHPNIFDTKIDIDKTHYGCPIPENKLSEMFSLNLTRKPYKICENVYFLGEIKNNISADIDDSAIVYESKNGLFIITGCSHAGILKILEQATEVTGVEKIYGVIGGFHLLNKSESEIEKIAQSFKNENIKYLAPCHCCDLKSKIILSKTLSIEEICTGDIITIE